MLAPVFSFPADKLLLVDFHQQVQLFGEQVVIIGQVVAEQRERFDKRTPTGHNLGPAI